MGVARSPQIWENHIWRYPVAAKSRQVKRKQARSKSPPNETGGSFRLWYLAVGFPMAFVAIGASLVMSAPIYFWLGICLATAGVPWLFADLCIYKPLSIITRLCGIAATLIAGAVIAFMAFRDAPLYMGIHHEILSFESGADANGIKWNDSYSGVMLIVKNTSDWPYSDIEIFIRTNIEIKDIGFSSSNCGGHAWAPFGVSISIMNQKTGKNVALPKPGGTTFKINCDKLLNHEKLEILAAVTGPKPADKPQWITATADYVTFTRPEHRTFKQCLSAACDIGNLPMPQEGW